ncbi:MAG: response regulator, partial [Acidobacteria bacterium]|nr:response regulator [Acidobacteriota bacterium]
APEPSAPLQTGDEILMLVEDDPVVRELGRISLTQLGYTVHTAQDGTEALATFRAHPRIALVCTDAIMPRMGAKELVPALREIDPGLKVLVASGYAPEEVRASLRHLNINGFLQKPMRKADLAAAVRAALDGNEASPAPPVESLIS